MRGDAPGILAYDGGEPVGWCAVEPRERYARFETARTLRPPDEKPLWSVTCFFVKRSHRGRGLSLGLLKAAVQHVGRCGGTLIEGYPLDLGGRTPDAFAWTGLASTFSKAGFREVARPSRTRRIVRRSVRRPAR